MAQYVTGYALPDVADTHRKFAQIFTLLEAARRRGQPVAALQAQYRTIYREFNEALNRAAAQGARAAQRAMRERLDRTQIRPRTSERPHLRDLLVARPLPARGGIALGAVGVAHVPTLEKAVDPDYPGSGSYWRAQEEGTTEHLGREIHGYFHGGGLAPDRPRLAFAGGGSMGHHPEFSPSSVFLGPRGGRGGPGTIMVPLKPRRFIADGAADGAAEWRAAIAAAETAAIAQTRRAMPAATGAGARRRRR